MNVKGIDLESLKKRLLDMRSDVMSEVNHNAEFSNNIGTDGVQDIGDVSANTYNRQILLSLNDGQRLMLKDVDDALDRIKEGEYGLCIECGEEINAKRLEVRPQAKYCVDCKTDIEKERKV
ncbi:MAG: TraR/DksA family transcriptional regulator [Deltaproteobacteria bacterium]|nr:TraR/DksA family transcriptional regulator [Deltaproteobacteria bacterium]